METSEFPNITALLDARAKTTPDAALVQCGDSVRTYAQAQDVSARLATAFVGVGIAPGDRVAILLPNRVEFVECILGLAQVGAIQVGLNVFLKGQFLRHQLNDSAASTLITDLEGLEATVPLLSTLPHLERVIVLDGSTVDSCPVPCLPYDELLAWGGPLVLPHPSRPGDLAALLYTSGTTGFPKGCMMSHGYYLHLGERWCEILDTTADDVVFSPLPLFHLGGQAFIFVQALTAGGTAVIEPRFSPSAYIARAKAVGATLTVGAGPMAVAMLSMPPNEGDRDHTLRTGVFGPLTASQNDAFEERYGIAVVSELYGQSECVPAAFSRPDGPRKPGTAGRPAEWLEVQIVDDDDTAVEAGTAGEIAIRPRKPHVMFQGYWGNPEATLDTFRTLWHHTGDLGRMDEDGYITFVGRKSDSMRRRGENVAAFEVETAIREFAKVTDVAVHAVPSPLGEDDIKACIVVADDQTMEPQELFAFLKDRLPYFAVPRYVDIVESLPRNAFDRVMKHELVERGNTDSTWDFDQLGLVISTAERRRAGPNARDQA